MHRSTRATDPLCAQVIDGAKDEYFHGKIIGAVVRHLGKTVPANGTRSATAQASY
jgi:hypothetical protein